MTNEYDSYYGSDLTDTDFGSILELCPRLQFVVWTCMHDSYRPPGDKKFQLWKALAVAPEQSNQVGIRELELDGFVDQLEVALPLLAGSQQTLERLHIYNLDEEEGRGLHGLGSMRFPTIKYLKTGDIELTSMGWANLISSCQALEHLRIFNDRWPVQENINPIIAAISNLKHIQTLQLGIDLQITNIGHPDLCRNFHMLSGSTHLRSLHLKPMCVSRRGLLGLCDIPSLQELHISVGYKHQHCLQSNEWVAFAERLAQVNESLHSLSLVDIPKITDEVMGCLARAKRLSDLAITYAPDITDTGVDLFLDSQEKDPNMVRKLRLRNCRRVRRGESNRFIPERVFTSL